MHLPALTLTTLFLTVLFATSNACAVDNDMPHESVISNCNFADGTSAQVYTFEGQTRFAHYNKAGQNDLFIKATSYANHDIGHEITFVYGAWRYIAVDLPPVLDTTVS